MSNSTIGRCPRGIHAFQVADTFPNLSMQEVLSQDDPDKRFFYSVLLQNEGVHFDTSNFCLTTSKPGDPYLLTFVTHVPSRTGISFSRPTWNLVYHEARKFKESKGSTGPIKIYAYGSEFTTELEALFAGFATTTNLGGAGTFTLISV